MTFSGVQNDIPYLCRLDDNIINQSKKGTGFKEINGTNKESTCVSCFSCN